MHRLPLLSLLAMACTLHSYDPVDSGDNHTDTSATDTSATDTSAADTSTTDTSTTDTAASGDGTELVALGYVGAATVTADSWTGTEALSAVAVDSGTERCRFEWTTSGTPDPQAGSCAGCSFAFHVTLQGGHVVGPSCDWLFDANGPPPADGGSISYAYDPSFDDGSGPVPTLLYYYVNRWIPLSTDVTYDPDSGALSYRVDVGQDYF